MLNLTEKWSAHNALLCNCLLIRRHTITLSPYPAIVSADNLGFRTMMDDKMSEEVARPDDLLYSNRLQKKMRQLETVFNYWQHLFQIRIKQ